MKGPDSISLQDWSSLYTALTLLHCNVHWAGAGTLQQLLVGLGRLVKQLHKECTCLLVLTTPDGGQLVQLLLDQTCILQGILQAIPNPKGKGKVALLKTCLLVSWIYNSLLI
jgi:hypothetical protein